MALTRLDNLISSKTGKYLYVSPDDFNASDELNNRGNSPIRPFKSIQRAFLEIARYSYLPGPDNDRFDQFTIMLMPGIHYIDNRPGLADVTGIDEFGFDQALSEWTDASNLDIGDPNNVLYKFNNTEGGAIIPRGSSMIGYDLRRTAVHPLFVPDPADRLEKRSAIFNVTGGCYFWQMTIRDGDLEPSSPLYDQNEGVGKVYYQNGKWDQLAVPKFSHHKLTVFEYADKEELGLYYQKVAKAFSNYQPTIDDPNEFGDRVQETRIVGPLSDIRSIESIKLDDKSTNPSLPASTVEVEVTSKVNHGYFKNQFVTIENNGLDDAINGTFSINEIDLVDGRVFRYRIPGVVAALGTTGSLISGTTYFPTSTPPLDANAVVKAEVDTVESASPYVFNCSIRSTWGICGIWANGLKATGFKSMVIAQYTGVSLQKDDRAFIRYDEYTNTFNQAALTDAFATVPYHTKGDAYWKDDWRNFHVRASEDAFIQCVSIFAVGYADHFLMESGGDMSITNSNSNFGNTSLHAKGHKGYAFTQDKGGYITDIVPPEKVVETTASTKKNPYYTLDIKASNDALNHNKLYLGDDNAYDPAKRPAATIDGFRLGAKSQEEIFVKLTPATSGAPSEHTAKLSPSGFKRFTATADILNPTGVTVNNADLDAANRIEENKSFIAHEAYGYITAKYPTLLTKEGITIEKCRRDIGYLVDATVQDLRLGGNINTIQAAESYFVNNALSYINHELNETLEGYYYARDLAIAATRNFTYLITGCETNGTAFVNIGDTSGVVQGMTIADYDPSQFTPDNKLVPNPVRPTNPVIPDNTFVKRVVDSATVEIGQKATYSEKKLVSDRFGDARNLILTNKGFIAAEAFDRMVLDYPGYTSPSGYTSQDCLDDIIDAIEAIAENVGYGGNAETWDAAYHYESGAVVYLAQKKDETLRCYSYAKDMCIQVLRNEDVFVYGTHGLSQTKDSTITYESPELVNDRNGDARDLLLANKNLIAHEAVERMVLQSSSATYTPTAATYDATTGDLELTIVGHGLNGATTSSASNAAYDAATGVLTITVANHGFVDGDRIQIADGSLSFTCSMDANATTHTYPRATDPVSGKWIEISNVTTNTFDVNVGDSPVVSFTPTDASYDPSTGLMELTVGNHGLSVGTNVQIAQDSLTFTCAQDNHATQHTYPRASDPASKSVPITAVTTTTITVQVLPSVPSTNTTVHTFVSASANAVRSGGNYSHTFVTATADGISREYDSVRFDYNALTFTCDMDQHGSDHLYPRVSDPAGNAILPVGATTNDTITVNVGKSLTKTFDVSDASYNETTGDLTLSIDNHSLVKGTSIRLADNSLTFTCSQDSHATQHQYPRTTVDTFTATDASYNPTTGVVTVTVASHGFEVGDQVKIADDSLTFTCGMDGDATNHTYPRSSDPISGQWITLENITANTFDIKVLDSVPSTNTSVHNFVSAAANGVSKKRDKAYQNALTITDIGSSFKTATGAVYDPATGIMEVISPSHGFVAGDRVKISEGSLTFTCAFDNNATEHAYPRLSDPNNDTWLEVSDVGANTFKVNVGAAGVNQTFTPGAATTYDPSSGDLVLDIGSHALTVGEGIVIDDGAVSMTCTMDGNQVAQSYPRAGKDKASQRSLPITSVTDTTVTINVGNAGTNKYFTPTAATYNQDNGDLTVTIGQHGLAVGSDITLKNNSLTFSCDKDANASNHSYPRPGTDPWAGKSIRVDNVGSTQHTITGASYTPTTGVLTLSIPSHGFSNGDYVKIADNSLVLTCDLDGNVSQKAYPRAGFDYPSGRWLKVSNVVANAFEVNVGQSTDASTHSFVSATTNGLEHQDGTLTFNVGASEATTFTPSAATYNPTDGKMVLTLGTGHGLSNGSKIKIAKESLKFTCAEDSNTATKLYPRASDPVYNTPVEVSEVTADTVTVQVLSTQPSTNTTAHVFTGVNNQLTATDAAYNAATGIMTLTVAGHGMIAGERVKIADDSITLTCAMDGNTAQKTYPRSTDPAFGKWLLISNITADTFDVHVGKSPLVSYTPSAAAYDPATGLMELTIGAHSYTVGDNVKIAEESLIFTCAQDNNATEHAYPRSSDPFNDKAFAVTSVTGTTITVQVLSTVPSTNTSVHTFVNALPNAVTAGGDYAHTFVSASANGITRSVVLAGDQYDHTFISALADAIEYEPQSPHTFVSGVTDSVKHLPQSAHTFKRAAANGIEKQGGSITINVGAALAGQQFSHDFVTATAGAVQTGGNYTHTFKSAVTNSVHKIFSVGGSRAYHNIDCVDDVVDLVEAIADNVAYGGNDKTWDAAYSYKTGAHVAGEEVETNYVFEQAKEMAAQVVRNQKVLCVGSHGLTQTTMNITVDIPEPVQDRFGDARNLIEANKDLIAEEAYARMSLQNPGFLPPTGNPQDCKDDILDFVTEVAYNVGYGGNDRVYDMANLYVTGAHVAGEEEQTLAAFEEARMLMIQALRQEKILCVGSHGESQTYDNALTVDAQYPQDNRVADAKALIDSNKIFIAEIAKGRMVQQYPNHQYQAPYTVNDCLDDLKDVVDVVAHNLAYGGNDRVWDCANFYVAGNASGADAETIYAFNQVRDIILQVITNEDVTIGGHTGISQVKDLSITNGVANGDCDNAKSTVTSLVKILTDTIASHASLATVTRTDSVTKCEDVRSSLNTLTTIATNAISDPTSLTGVKVFASDAAYNPTTGIIELTIGAHNHSVGDAVAIPNESLVFTCAQDNNATQHSYPRSTDPRGKTTTLITSITNSTISVQVLDSVPSTNTTAHTFVTSLKPISIGGIKRTRSLGKCNDIRNTIDTLFNIVQSTVSTPTSLDSVTRTISNGSCQNVASSVTTLFKIITDSISNQGYLQSIERVESPLGLAFGPAVNATATTTNTYIYLTLSNGVYTTEYNPTTDDTITQDTLYPQCNTQSDTIRQYFSNIGAIIQNGLTINGLPTVARVQPSSATSTLSSRSTLWTLSDWTPGTVTGSNPHNLETGTVVRLVPRPRWDPALNGGSYVDVDKRNVRLPNGFDTNTKYYVIAPARVTKPEDYSSTTDFNGSKQTGLMLASSKENAAAGIYIHSAEVEAIHPDVEIDVYQFVLDDKYDLHQYKCELDASVSDGIRTDVPHIFDVPFANISGHQVFVRENEGGSVPLVGQAYQFDPSVSVQSGPNAGRIRQDVFFWARYQNEKVFTLHTTKSDAINNVNQITFQPGSYDFSAFADKRESPMRYDPSYDNPTNNFFGKWYLNVENESTQGSGTYRAQSILKRFHDADYDDASGKDKTNDSWFERVDDDREADERIYRLRYVVPKYLKSVRDPLNGFTIKVRKDETRKLLPQKLVLKPVVQGANAASFYNPVQATEKIGYTTDEFKVNNLSSEIAYDPYKKDLVGNTSFVKTIETENYISMSIQSGRYVNGNLELTVFDQSVSNTALLNETFTTVKITPPQGGTTLSGFTVDKTTSGANPNPATRVEWFGNSSGYAYAHAILNVPGTSEWHLILKGVVGKIDYSPTDNIRFSQGSVFADLLGDQDYGKSLYIKDLIKKGYPEYYYRQNGAPVYTITPGDEITDDANIKYYVESVTDVGDLNDTFYVFDNTEIQKRIFGQQDGIYYLTAVRGNMSPYPTGAGNLGNFRDFKFSQPISRLYPLNYKNDPLWYQVTDPGVRDTSIVDPPQTYSAADNYIHGLVSVNDFKGSMTKEAVEDFVSTHAFANKFAFKDANSQSILLAQAGNAASGSEDRLIPITGYQSAGTYPVVSEQRMYVELRRPSIARAGNHTFEYLGFGPGNYSTGMPVRQEVVLEPIEDFYAQSKKQDGGLVFYTGLNSNGDLYIGNRKIDAITGEEEFLESAKLVDSEDDEEDIGNLVTTFDTPVTFNEYITVVGGDDGDKTSTFNSPVSIVIEGQVRKESLTIVSNVDPSYGDDGSLDTAAQQRNPYGTLGHIVLTRNRISASVFQINPRGSQGAAQGYRFQNHASSGSPVVGSNVTPDQAGTWHSSQIVQYGNAGGPLTGDVLFKGSEVGRSGSLGWVFANYYRDLGGQVESITCNGTLIVQINWQNNVTNDQLEITSGSSIRIGGLSDNIFNDVHPIDASSFQGSNDWIKISIPQARASISGDTTRLWSAEPNATMEFSTSDWKEVGVLGAEAIRTETESIGDYKVGINTVERAGSGAWATNFVDTATTPRANLDVVGNAFISGVKAMNFVTNFPNDQRQFMMEENAFLVGGESGQPDYEATFRISTAKQAVGINVSSAELDRALVVDGLSRYTNDAKFEQDIEVNGGGGINTAEIRTSITTGTFNFLMDTGFTGLAGTPFQGGLHIAGSTQNISLGNVTTGEQHIHIGGLSTDSNINIGSTIDGPGTNESKITIGGAYASSESLSYAQIGSKSLKVDGDQWLGYARTISDSVNLASPAGTVEFFSNSGGPSTINFALNASEINIAGQGGVTTINNQLEVAASAKFNSNIHLCGGSSSFSFVGDRGQMGSSITTHADGIITAGVTYNKNVDILNVIQLANTDEGYNQIDTVGGGPWHGTAYQQLDPSYNLPTLTGDEYYLPLKYQPVKNNGDQYFAEGDYVIVDSPIVGTTGHPEVVQIIPNGLVRTNDSIGPWFIAVKRQPFGTFTGVVNTHPDTTAVFKVNVQFDSTWTEQDLDGTGPQDNVYLAEFGGQLRAGIDYIIVGREDTDNDNIADFGELIKVDTELDKESQKFTISNCGTPDQIVFEVDSTTGEVTIGNPDIPGADFTVNTSITLAGGCGTHKSEMITGNVTPDAGNFNSYSYHIRGISDADIDKVELGDNIRIKPDSITGTDILETDRDNYITEITKSPGNNTIKVYSKLQGGTVVNLAEFYIVKNEKLLVTNGDKQPIFEVDSCTGTTKIGNTFRRADIVEIYPSSQTAAQSVATYSTLSNYRVHSYWLDPTTQNGGGTTTLAAAVASHTQYDRQLTVQDVGSGESAFKVDDLVMIGAQGDMANGTGFKEIMVIREIQGSVLICDKAQEGTTEKPLTDFVVGDVVSRLLKHNETSIITDMQERQRGSTPYLSTILATGHIIQTKLDYFNWVRFENIDPNTTANSYFLVNGNMNGTVHQTTMDEEIDEGNYGFIRGALDLVGDLTMTGGKIEVFDSVNQSRILYLGNDKGHADHAGNLQVDAGCTIRGNISVFPGWCPETILTQPVGYTESFKVDNLGNVTCGESLTVTGTPELDPAPSYKSFTVGNLAVNGANEFSVRRTGEIASFGIDPYWTKTGGIHTRYVSSGSDAADKILVPNIVYMANVTTDDALVLTLPSAPITGDTVRIVEVGGDLSYKTSLVIRTPESSGTAIQGDNTGTLLGGRTTPYPSGELVVQTPNAGFTLIYLGSVASDGRVGIPTTDQGWWLMEV